MNRKIFCPILIFFMALFLCHCTDKKRKETATPLNRTNTSIVITNSREYFKKRLLIQKNGIIKSLAISIKNDDNLDINKLLTDINHTNISSLLIAAKPFNLNYNTNNTKLRKLTIITNTVNVENNALYCLDSLKELEIFTSQNVFSYIKLPKSIEKLSIGGKFQYLPSFLLDTNISELTIVDDSLYYFDSLSSLKTLKILNIQNTLLGKKLRTQNKYALQYLKQLKMKLKHVYIKFYFDEII